LAKGRDRRRLTGNPKVTGPEVRLWEVIAIAPCDRQGHRPHPRHWQALAELVGVLSV